MNEIYNIIKENTLLYDEIIKIIMLYYVDLHQKKYISYLIENYGIYMFSRSGQYSSWCGTSYEIEYNIIFNKNDINFVMIMKYIISIIPKNKYNWIIIKDEKILKPLLNKKLLNDYFMIPFEDDILDISFGISSEFEQNIHINYLTFDEFLNCNYVNLYFMCDMFN